MSLETILEALVQAILGWAVQYPTVAAVLMVVGTLRLVMKPLMSFLNEVVLIIPGDADNQILKNIETSKVYTVLMYILDLLTSIKIKKP